MAGGIGAVGNSRLVAGSADSGGKSAGKKSRLTREIDKGHTMTTKQVQALKKELLELDVELKSFKGEILAGRIKQLEQEIRRPAGRSPARTQPVPALSYCRSDV